MPIKKFADAEILTANEVNTYLMDQTVVVFENAAARDAAFSTVDPALPTRGDGGRLCYLKSTAVIQYWNGSTWVDSSSFTTPDDSITNAKVNTSAAIALSKLASGTSGQIIVANASGVPTYVTLSGDATISNAGVLSIGANNVALGTDTTGNYVATITGGVGITSTAATSGEGTTHSLSIGQDVATSASTTFAGITITGSASVSGAITASNITVSGSVSVTGNVVSHAVPETAASLTNAIDGKIVKVSSGLTLTTTGGSWTDGTQFTVINTNASAITITAGTGTTFLAAPLNGSNVKLRAQYSTATFIYESGTGWYVIGDLTSS
jgi:hypothetical protein